VLFSAEDHVLLLRQEKGNGAKIDHRISQQVVVIVRVEERYVSLLHFDSQMSVTLLRDDTSCFQARLLNLL